MPLKSLRLTIAFASVAFLQLIVGIAVACVTQKRKTLIFYLCTCGFGTPLITIVLIMLTEYFQYSNYVNSVAIGLCYFILYLLYSRRIKSLGLRVNYEGLVHFIPYIVLFVSLAPIASFLLTKTMTSRYQLWLKIAFVIHWTIFLSCEIFCYAILLQKLKLMLEYRPHVKRILMIQTSVALVVRIFIDLIFLFLGLLDFGTFYNLRAYIVSLQVLFVVDFYRRLVKDINDSQNGYSDMLPYEAEECN